jgi:opacity protein-like surface antigen
MRRCVVALAAIALSQAAVAAELDVMRGSDNPAYLVPQPAQPVLQPVVAAAPAVWNWTGFYVGAHAGFAFASTNFSDPFGTSVFGDTVRSPGFLGGGQIGFNWQPAGSRWVLGIEADAGALSSDGTSTCFAASAQTINATCRVRPQTVGTLTGRIGYAFGPADELHDLVPIGALPFRSATLVYGKAGVAMANDRIDMATNNDLAGFVGADVAANSANTTFWGWTVGLGIEHALTAAWSFKVEYDYLGFPSRSVANLGSSSFDPSGFPISAAARAPPACRRPSNW